MPLGIFDREIEMDLFVHIAEERNCGRKNKNVNRGEAAQQEDDSVVLWIRECGGRNWNPWSSNHFA